MFKTYGSIYTGGAKSRATPTYMCVTATFLPSMSYPLRNIATLSQTFVENSNQSARRVSLQLEIPRTSLRRMMKSLNLQIYRPRLLQALNEDDFDRRVEFAEWVQNHV